MRGAPRAYFFRHSFCTITQSTFSKVAFPSCGDIGIECQFYLLLPLLFRVCVRISLGRKWAVPVLMAAVCVSADLAWRALIPQLIGHVSAKVISYPGSPVITWSVFSFLKWFGMEF